MVITHLHFKNIYLCKFVPSAKYALVLGAGLEKDGSPTDILRDRIETAKCLLENQKVDLIVMSGSNSPNGSETLAMRDYGLKIGMPSNVIKLDNKGISTFNSLINFKKIYGLNTVIIITQKFHLPRALMLASLLKINAVGCRANFYRFGFCRLLLWTLREIVAYPYNLIKLLLMKF